MTPPPSYQDEDTGRTVLHWSPPDMQAQHLYFTSPSTTRDDQWLIYMSSKDHHCSLRAVYRPSGEHKTLVPAVPVMKSYVYPEGGKHGISKSSPLLDPVRKRLYWIQDDTCRSIDIVSGDIQHVYRMPEGWITAFNAISHDGSLLCIPLAPAAAFSKKAANQGEQMQHAAAAFETENLVSRLLMVDCSTGKIMRDVEVPFWVTHVSFHPRRDDQLIFNREGIHVADRVWALDADNSFRLLNLQDEDYWYGHENWLPDGSGIVYHGNHIEGGYPEITCVDWEGQLLWKEQLTQADFAHAIVHKDNAHIIIDTLDGMVSIVNPVTGSLTHLCRHDSSFSHQDVHPHPVPTADGKSIIFTSDKSGRGQVYEVMLD